MLSVVLLGCKKQSSSLRAGQVAGVLHNADGTSYGSGVAVFATKHTAGDQHVELKYKTDSKGAFLLEDLQPGEYSLSVLIPPKPDHGIGIDNIPKPTVGYIVNKTKRLSFEVPVNGGLDLGDIEVTSIEPPGSGTAVTTGALTTQTPGAVFTVNDVQLQVEEAQVGDAFVVGSTRMTPSNMQPGQQVVGVSIAIRVGEMDKLKQLHPWITDGGGATTQPGYMRVSLENHKIDVLFAVPKTATGFVLHFDAKTAIRLASFLK
jgi:hypothetical protein